MYGQEIESEDEFALDTPAIAAARSAVLFPAGIEAIAEMIGDRDVPFADISRRIALQIAGLIKVMVGDGADRPVRRRVSHRDLNDQIKAHRELQKTLTESETLSKKDVLNLDGPKFQYVFTEIIGWFRRSLTQAGIEEALARNVLLQFGDLVKANDERIRHELGKIGPQ
ncbi:MAG: hypothetical protein ACRD3F_13445 [Acidobacteriaceae bacterium]